MVRRGAITKVVCLVMLQAALLQRADARMRRLHLDDEVRCTPIPDLLSLTPACRPHFAQ